MIIMMMLTVSREIINCLKACQKGKKKLKKGTVVREYQVQQLVSFSQRKQERRVRTKRSKNHLTQSLQQAASSKRKKKKGVNHNVFITNIYYIENLEIRIKTFKKSLSKEQFESLRDRSFVFKVIKVGNKKIKNQLKDKAGNNKNPLNDKSYQYRDWREIYTIN